MFCSYTDVSLSPCVYAFSIILTSVSQAAMFSWDAVFPLFAFTTRELGGLGLPVFTLFSGLTFRC